MIGSFAVHLFWRNIAGGSNGSAWLRERTALAKLGQSIDNSDSGVFGVAGANDDVGRFQVAMHNTLLVGRLQPVRNLAGYIQSVYQPQSSVNNSLLQVLALDVSPH